MSKQFRCTRVEFTVTGGGAFPIDMLRYDRCFPRDSYAVENMMVGHGVRSVELVSYIPSDFRPDSVPTKGRWENFLWRVEG
jgi:hypothetical protein